MYGPFAPATGDCPIHAEPIQLRGGVKYRAAARANLFSFIAALSVERRMQCPLT